MAGNSERRRRARYVAPGVRPGIAHAKRIKPALAGDRDADETSALPNGICKRDYPLDFLKRKPISLRGGTAGFMSLRMASKTTLNLASYFCSKSFNRFASLVFDASIRRKRTKVRIISTLTEIARLLRKTLESIATPCSVKAIGAYLRPLRSALEITICDLHFSNSLALRTNIKSAGNRSPLRGTACFSALVVTPYSAAKIAVEHYPFASNQINRFFDMLDRDS